MDPLYTKAQHALPKQRSQTSICVWLGNAVQAYSEAPRFPSCLPFHPRTLLLHHQSVADCQLRTCDVQHCPLGFPLELFVLLTSIWTGRESHFRAAWGLKLSNLRQPSLPDSPSGPDSKYLCPISQQTIPRYSNISASAGQFLALKCHAHFSREVRHPNF